MASSLNNGKPLSADVVHDENVEKPDRGNHVENGAHGTHVDEKTYAQRSRHLVRQFDLRIIPLLAWVYLLNYLDRGNVGNSKVLNEETGDDLLQQTNMSTYGYAVALTLFSLAYTLFEVPSNWIMKRFVRPSRWMASLLFAWGACTIGFAGVQTYAEVVVIRFLIGVFEAGFFPGIVYFITFWYRPEERSLRIAFVVAHATLAGAFGGCIAYGVGHMDGYDGLPGFRWLFIIEGIITVICATLVLFFLPDYPARARWLTDDEKDFAETRLRDQAYGGFTKEHATRQQIRETVFSPRMLMHYVAYITDCVPLGSLTFFAPTIVKGLGYTSIHAQLLTVPPWVVAYVVCLGLSFSADHFNARGWHIAVVSCLGGAGWLTAGLLPADAYLKRYGCLVLAACGAFPSSAPLSAWVTCNVPSVVTMGIATALNNSSAGIGQIITQWIWKASEEHQGYPTGNFVCAACSFATAALAVALRLIYGRMNQRNVKDAEGRDRVWIY